MALYDPEALREFYNRYGEREWKRFESPLGRVRAHVIHRFLERHIPIPRAAGGAPGPRVLDAGCGPARFALPLLRRGCRVTLLDLSEVMLAEAVRRVEQEGLAGGLEGALRCSYLALEGIADARMDAVLCLGGSLNYMPERAVQALSELRRVLRPGGMLLGGVMNTMGSLRAVLAQGWKPADDLLGPEDLTAVCRTGALEVGGRPISEHRARMFHRSELEEALGEAGLHLVQASATECLLSLGDAPLVELERDPAWPALLSAEEDACVRCPEAGAHMLFAARRL